jgi:hypothetical protein
LNRSTFQGLVLKLQGEIGWIGTTGARPAFPTWLPPRATPSVHISKADGDLPVGRPIPADYKKTVVTREEMMKSAEKIP